MSDINQSITSSPANMASSVKSNIKATSGVSPVVAATGVVAAAGAATTNNSNFDISSFFNGFTDLFSNKHFWMVIFVISLLLLGYYYYSTYLSKNDNQELEQEYLPEQYQPMPNYQPEYINNQQDIEIPPIEQIQEEIIAPEHIEEQSLSIQEQQELQKNLNN